MRPKRMSFAVLAAIVTALSATAPALGMRLDRGPDDQPRWVSSCVEWLSA